ncbi:MAG TPA: efflux RND transporter periplasmic adaptor subunit [Candidatus Acidoferrum sp.]|nr:efflux RND transporter periplasmic adaptor subunit [Candidatus Acidoferrum sp.]
MRTMETKESNSGTGRNFRRLSYAAVLAILGLAAAWFATRHSGSTKGISHDPMSNMSAMGSSVSASSSEAPAVSDELQVELAVDDLKKAQVRTVRVGVEATAAKLRVPGIVRPNEYREVHVTPLVGGIVKQVPVVLGDHVRRGQPLAIIFSSELAEAETQYVSYLAELEAEHKKLVRTQNLVRLGAASQQEEEEVGATHAAHESHVQAALERLKLLGASDHQIAALKQAEQIDPNFRVPAPINGVVLTRTANLGSVVNSAQELFTVADLSTVWVMASVNEKDFASVSVGSAASITAPAYPGHVWNGRVSYIQPQVEPNTRTAQARIEVANPGESLRIEMYVDVDFTSHGAVGPVVPESAVQSIGEWHYVFLPVEGSEGSFKLRQVRLGPAANGHYAVLEGLKPNDEVVAEGSFILKAEGVRQHPELQ